MEIYPNLQAPFCLYDFDGGLFDKATSLDYIRLLDKSIVFFQQV